MTLSSRVSAALGTRIRRLTPLHGGDLSRVCRVDLASGDTVVAKTGPLVAVEARMLQAMASSAALVPRVLHAEPGLLVIEFLHETPATPAAWARLGVALKTLHNQTGPRYGWAEDYAFGPVTIANGQSDDWPQFWAEQRLLAAPNEVPRDILQQIETLCGDLPNLIPATPPPAMLHGDLWSGNVLFSNETAWMIDPACYFGDAEVDLAMLTLFGRPPPAFDEAYGPLPDGFVMRRAVYQLWPALVHLRLFGGGYRGLVKGLLDRLGA